MNTDGIRPAVRRRSAVRSRGVVPPVVKSTPAPPRSVAAAHRKPAPAVPLRQAGRPPRPAAASQSPRYQLPEYHAPERPKRIIRKRLTVRGIIWRSAAALAVAVVLTGGFLGWRAYTNLHKVFRGTHTVAALTNKPVTPELLDGEGDGRVNILLLGIGGPGHDGPDLTDTIVVLSVDPVNNTAAMLSVPRDLWVQQPIPYFGKQQKINAAYESGKYHTIGHLDATNKNTAAVQAGFANIDQVIKNVLDININYHMLVNFQAFRQAVDTVGGITVDVPTPLVDPTMAWENHWNPVLAPAGVQQMDGVKALMYARSRETSSDFARSQRQRQILVALKDKVLTAGTLSNPAKIDGLMNAFGDNVYSDMTTQAATRLYGIMKNIADDKVASVGLTDEGHKLVMTDHVGNISVDRPIAGFDNYADIQAYVHSQLPDGYLVREHAAVTVLAPAAAGATAAATVLKNYGYNVVATGTVTQVPPAAVIVDLSRGKAPFTLHYLQDRYGVKAVTKLPDGISLSDSTTKFVIIVPK